jgi:hypothetical protein
VILPDHHGKFDKFATIASNGCQMHKCLCITTNLLEHDKMRKILPLTALLLTTLFAANATVQAQTPAAAAVETKAPERAISTADKAAAVELLAQRLSVNYVKPDASEKMAAALRANLRKGDYDQVSTHKEFAELLTTQLRELQHDKHLRIAYIPEGARADRPPVKAGAKRAAQVTERMRAFSKYQNFGFYKMERLAGNIIYLRLDGFMDLDVAKQALSSMMNVTANADALIIDLRENGGGDPRSVAHVASYLFDNKKLHLSSMYFRATKERQEFWTDPAVPGPRLGANKPVYILTSKDTFSAAEDFTYTLQHLKRVTVIGETTGGGAHPINAFRVDPYLLAIIPVGESIGAVTKANWEGSGVTPDIALPADKALAKAHALAIKHVLPAVKDDEERVEMNKKLAELEG